MDAGIPLRGEIWRIDFGNPVGREQGFTRPAMVVSSDRLNAGSSGVVMVIPLTTVDRDLPSHIAIHPPDGGLKKTSFAKTEDLRSVSIDRFRSWLGSASPAVMGEIARVVRILLELP